MQTVAADVDEATGCRMETQIVLVTEELVRRSGHKYEQDRASHSSSSVAQPTRPPHR
jgi:hypothetical protein